MNPSTRVEEAVRPEALALDEQAAPWSRIKWRTVVSLVALGLSLPWALSFQRSNRFIAQLLIQFFVFATVTQCWNLVLGFSGIFSIAQLVFYAIGGYTTAMVTLHLGWSPWAGLISGAAVAAVAAVVLGVPILRLAGVYVMLLTLGFHELARNFLATGTDLFGRYYGLQPSGMGFEGWFGGRYTTVFYYYAALLVFSVATYAVWRIIHSPIGMAFVALRDGGAYAVSRGVNPYRSKLLLFAYSAFFTGLAGAFMTHYLRLIAPGVISFDQLILLVVMIVLGGWGTFGGPIVGAGVTLALLELIQPLGAGFTKIAFGLLMGLILILAPQGLLPLLKAQVRALIRTFREAG